MTQKIFSIFGKVYKSFGNLSNNSKKLSKFGIFFSFLVFSLGIILYYYSTIFHVNYELELMGRELIKNGVVLFAEFIIAALVIDFAFANNKES